MHAAHELLRQIIFGFILLLGCSQIGLVRTDIRSAIPLAVKSPYLSVWTPREYLGNDYINFWTTNDNPITLRVRLNNSIYIIAPGGNGGNTSLQTGLKVTPTQSIFNITIGPVIITYNFFTPIDTDDLKRLSLPVSYVAISARSTDNQIHPVQLLVAPWIEWSSNNDNATVRWNSRQVGPLFDLNMERVTQTPLSEENNGALWGTFHVFTNNVGTTFGIHWVGYEEIDFQKQGRLNDTMDSDFRPFSNYYPALGFAKEMNAGPLPSPNVFFGISRVARPAINTTEGPMNHLWEDFFNGDEKEMIQFAFEHAEDALARCEALDSKILSDATQQGGESYSKLISAAFRQSFGGIELVGTQNRTWAFIKDLGLSLTAAGSCQRVDLIYANMPVHLYLNPKILKHLLEPLLVYQESGLFTEQWAVSDLGAAYPQCTGGHDRSMGVEQSANMIIMIDAYVRATNDTGFLRQHYVICKKWADYLVTNGLYPGSALTSDDFLGPIVNSTNLSLKAIVGIAAMADIAQRVDITEDYLYYRSTAEKYIAQWIILSHDPEQKHIKFSYNDQTGDSWALLYNLYADFLLGTDLIPNDIITQQALWYFSQAGKYGIPLGNGTKDTKVDWLLFTAATSPSKTLRQAIYDRVALFLNEDPSYHPFRDRFDTTNANYFYNYVNRPTVGAVFAPLTIIDYSRFVEDDLL